MCVCNVYVCGPTSMCACYNINCSPHSKSTAEIVSHDVMELQFLVVGGILPSLPVAVSVKVNVFLLPLLLFLLPLVLPLFLCPLAAPALQLFFVSIRLFIFCALLAVFSFCPLLLFLLLCSFSLCFIFHNPIQRFSFRFINRRYTLSPSLSLSPSASYALHRFLFFLSFPATRISAGRYLCTVFPVLSPPTPFFLHTSHSKFPHISLPHDRMRRPLTRNLPVCKRTQHFLN